MSAATGGHGLGPTRARVLNQLQGAVGVSAQEVAEELGIHINTARFHLEALVDSGYAQPERERPNGQGRPRILYLATAQAPTVRTSHLLDLTQALVRHLVLADDEPVATAEKLGRAWGQEIAAESAKERRQQAIPALLRHTDAMGFSSQVTDENTIEFHRCPYRNLEPAMRDAVCNVHLGMLQGFLEARGSDVQVTSLTPGPTCIATLQPSDVSSGGGS